ncbi:hypothetical protein [Massiliimalia timonensis]|uniref:hypothetical protein n=1 Tax=Massiliimalia timonensis TaxID=1987501 RepID=UPI0018A04CF3|nr:hypothetical protein [Massiliimalia timonensis]
MKRILPSLLFGVTACCLIACILLSADLTQGISQGIHLCLNSLIPSLYFFMILSNLIMNSRLCQVLARPFRFLSRKVLHLDDSLFTIFLLSMLGGYPIGAKLVADQIKQGNITPQTGRYLLNFCVNCSPAFLMSYLSVRLWGNIGPGFLIYLSQILSALLIAVFTGLRHPCKIEKSVSLSAPKLSSSAVFVSSVNQATHTMGIICSFVVVFCAAFPILDRLLSSYGTLSIWLKGLLEVTAGCQNLSELSAYSSILAASLFTSFGGVCVFLQITALISGTGISIIKWLLWRIPYTLLSVGITYLGILLFPQSLSCFGTSQGAFEAKWFTVSPAASVSMIVTAGVLLFLSVPKSVKKHGL